MIYDILDFYYIYRHIHIPTGAALDKIIDGSFKNFDSDHDNFIERYEFDTLIIVADSDSKLLF